MRLGIWLMVYFSGLCNFSGIILMVSILIGSQEAQGSNSQKIHFVDGKVSGTDKDRIAPLKLIEIFEKNYIEHYKSIHLNEVEKGDSYIKGKMTQKHLNLEVKIWAKHPGILKANTHYHLARGGGEIDLKDLIVGKRGGFHIKISNRKDDDVKGGISFNRVMFWSGAKKRSVDGRIYGAGCNKLFDVTAAFNQKMLGNGFELELENRQYLSYIAGVFYFSYMKADDFYIGTLSFTNSQKKQLLCKR